jgi:histidinol-phosphate/aromatic aminotransferase/cobyric acid decarboxylase-like protein
MVWSAISTVYSYRHPEIRQVIDGLLRAGFPHDVFLRATQPPGALDAFHDPIIERVLEFYRADVPALAGFPHRYPTSGSEEGIREVMTSLRAEGVRSIYVLRGDYEGYRVVAEQRGMETIEVERTADPRALPAGIFFLSNPSAIDGNIVPNERIVALAEAGHRIFYDLAYLGSTRPHTFDLSHPSIFAAVVSFSKSYGLFYDRVGFTLARHEVPSLYGNKWFKSIFGLLIADAVVRTLTRGQLFATYRPVQESIVDEIRAETGLALQPSDAFLLAHLPAAAAAPLTPAQRELIARFLRGDGYRFCLTPYFVARDPQYGTRRS